MDDVRNLISSYLVIPREGVESVVGPPELLKVHELVIPREGVESCNL